MELIIIQKSQKGELSEFIEIINILTRSYFFGEKFTIK